MCVSANSGPVWSGATPNCTGGVQPSQYPTSKNQLSGNSYDASGNQTTVNGNALTFDAENRLITVLESRGASETLAYDAAGRRVIKNQPSGTTVYVYDAFGQMAAGFKNTSAQSPACLTCYLGGDQEFFGSTRLVMDSTGAVVHRHDYLPFGEEIPGNGAGRNSQWGSTTNVRSDLPGRRLIQETGPKIIQCAVLCSGAGEVHKECGSGKCRGEFI